MPPDTICEDEERIRADEAGRASLSFLLGREIWAFIMKIEERSMAQRTAISEAVSESSIRLQNHKAMFFPFAELRNCYTSVI